MLQIKNKFDIGTKVKFSDSLGEYTGIISEIHISINTVITIYYTITEDRMSILNNPIKRYLFESQLKLIK